jgi:hypothetical protein
MHIKVDLVYNKKLIKIVMYENRQFMIFNTSELSSIDFTQVLETSEETVRKSVDDTKTFVKWDGDIPSCVESLTTKEGPYTYDEIRVILENDEWIRKDEMTNEYN